MATRGEIEFDFNRAREQADRIDGIADRLSKLSAKEFNNTLQNLSANWKGESALAYLSKGNRLQGEMNSTVNELRSVASDIRTIAKKIYDAEMAVLNIAENRTY